MQQIARPSLLPLFPQPLNPQPPNRPTRSHLHGVFWATMGGATEQAGRPVNSTDITPYWDQAVARLGNESIIAYPQAWGDAGRGDPSEGQGSKFRQVRPAAARPLRVCRRRRLWRCGQAMGLRVAPDGRRGGRSKHALR